MLLFLELFIDGGRGGLYNPLSAFLCICAEKTYLPLRCATRETLKIVRDFSGIQAQQRLHRDDRYFVYNKLREAPLEPTDSLVYGISGVFQVSVS